MSNSRWHSLQRMHSNTSNLNSNKSKFFVTHAAEPYGYTCEGVTIDNLVYSNFMLDVNCAQYLTLF